MTRHIPGSSPGNPRGTWEPLSPDVEGQQPLSWASGQAHGDLCFPLMPVRTTRGQGSPEKTPKVPAQGQWLPLPLHAGGTSRTREVDCTLPSSLPQPCAQGVRARAPAPASASWAASRARPGWAGPLAGEADSTHTLGPTLHTHTRWGAGGRCTRPRGSESRTSPARPVLHCLPRAVRAQVSATGSPAARLPKQGSRGEHTRGLHPQAGAGEHRPHPREARPPWFPSPCPRPRGPCVSTESFLLHR